MQGGLPIRCYWTRLQDFAFRYLLFEGSLVGLYHSAGPLPWDDDVDVVMMEEDALELIQMVESKKAIILLNETNTGLTSCQCKMTGCIV